MGLNLSLLILKSDTNFISPSNIHTVSSKIVMKIKNFINFCPDVPPKSKNLEFTETCRRESDIISLPWRYQFSRFGIYRSRFSFLKENCSFINFDIILYNPERFCDCSLT